ncbi:MAG: hypothetical protein Q7S34_03830 [bacterium]|nr:hypothetical protein [bacterium]
MIPRKILLTVSGVWAGLAVAMGTLEPFRLCGDSWRKCMDLNYSADLMFLPIIPLFLFALITYKMRDEAYHAWLRFSYAWVPLSMLLIFIAPDYSHDWLYPIDKGSIAFVMSAIFCVVSLVIIAVKYISLRKERV